MGDLSNAVKLMRSTDFRDLIQAGTVFQAREVFAEVPTTTNHANRLNMAKQIIASPDLVADRMANIIACDQSVASIAPDGDLAGLTDELLVGKIAEVWDPVATTYFPAA